MKLSLRWRIFLTLVPLLLLVAVLGVAGAALLHRLGGSIDAILKENYRSVVYMQHLNESLERIDSSFHIALAGSPRDARDQHASNWKIFRENLELQQLNITLPGEAELVQQLIELAGEYEKRGLEFYAARETQSRSEIYFEKDTGLLDRFRRVKSVSNEILRINQENMEDASRDARQAARVSLVAFALGFAAALGMASLLAWHTFRTIVRPITAVTESALAISAGNLDQVVPVVSNDELGQVADAFNLMAHRLRDYRQSQTALVLRLQRTTQATIDSFPEPVLVIQPTGSVELANPAAQRMLGVAPGSDGVWQPPEPLRQPLADALLGQRDYRPEGFDKTIVITQGGFDRVVLPRILVIRDRDGTALGAAVVLQDVTRLRLLDQMKGNLVATASHELKTPLTSVRLAVHLLLEEAAGPLNPKQTELLLDARENSERLLSMVNNLLDLARLEQGWRQLDIQPTSAASLLQAAADTIRPRAQDKGMKVAVEVPPDFPAVAVDPVRMGTALRNLVENALTYTDAGGRITLSAATAPDAVQLCVADTGVGIAPEFIPHLFEKFSRIPGQGRGSGTGLGLAIVHEIVVAHGGTIACESQPGAGTVFRLTLPVSAGQALLAPGVDGPIVASAVPSTNFDAGGRDDRP